MAVNTSKSQLAGVAIIILGGSVLMIVRRGAASRPPSSDTTYFYDMATGDLFAAPLESSPPIDAPGGEQQGVKALVAGCGGCDVSQLRIVRLESLTAESAAALRDTKATAVERRDALVAGHRVALPPASPGDPPTWVPQDSPQGRAITARTPENACDGEPASICSP